MAIERGVRSGSQRSQISSHNGGAVRYRQPLGGRIKDCCRSTIAFIFSNVGVCGLMVGYTIMGAFLFQNIEGPEEERKTFHSEIRRNRTIELLWNTTLEFNTLYPENWTSNVTNIVKLYQESVVRAVEDGWDGSDGKEGTIQWSTEGGFLYSLTVITTIGYGHISPKTELGKIMTIVYTIFGMPVFLLYMANMGDILAKSLKWTYGKICVCKKEKTPEQPRYDSSVAWRSATQTLRGPVDPNCLPNTSDEDSFGENYGVHGGRTRVPSVYRPQRESIRSIDGRGIPHSELQYLDTGEEVSIETESWRSLPSEKTDITSINIPLTVSLVIMVALLFGGTKLFQEYEGWDILTSFYFCFISLTTIGFGDYVPGSSLESASAANRLSFIYCALYLMFGLALLSMCFNLMQEEVVHKITTCLKAVRLFNKKEPTIDPRNTES